MPLLLPTAICATVQVFASSVRVRGYLWVARVQYVMVEIVVYIVAKTIENYYREQHLLITKIKRSGNMSNGRRISFGVNIAFEEEIYVFN